jgi:hypothetical protein
LLGNTKKALLRSFVKGQCTALRLSSAKFRYQPTPLGLSILGSGLASTRSCDDRLTLIREHLPQYSKNILDIGSNVGYYLFELSRMGYLCHGLESDPDLVCFTSLMTYATGMRGVSCECGKFDLSFVGRMPRYDVILCLSVIHHIILAEGMDVAESILQHLASKTNHVLFFEMGQSNEIQADWSKRLPAMEPDPETWISEWLLKSGFRRVKTIGVSRITVPRFLVAAYP